MITYKMLVGPPCVGKSTWAQRKSKESEYKTVILSTDTKIELLCKDANTSYAEGFKQFFQEAEKNMVMDLELAIKCNWNIIHDQTNLTAKSRARKLKLVPPHYFIEAVVFSPSRISVDTLFDRNVKRFNETGKWLDPNVIEKMYYDFEYPTYDEGFNKITEVEVV